MKKIFLLLAMSASLFAAAQDYSIQNGEVVITKTVQFKTGSAELDAGSDDALVIIKKYLDDKAYISLLRVESHVSSAGEAAQHLTQERSAAICKRLIQLGVNCKRLIAVGFGNTKPVADNSTSEGKSMNNRTVFVNAALRDRPIGGMPVDGGGVVAAVVCL